MPSILDSQCATILYAAAAATLGLAVRTDNPTRARQVLYAFRRTLADPTLADLHIRASPHDVEHEIWIIRRQEIAATLALLEP